MPEWYDQVLEHWPFVAIVTIAMLLGEVFKRALWTRERTESGKPRWFWWWARKTMPLHPVLFGVVVGLFWTDPEDRGWDRIPSVAYFAFAGALSVWAFEVIRRIAKRKGVSISLPGDSIPPESLEEDPEDECEDSVDVDEE